MVINPKNRDHSLLHRDARYANNANLAHCDHAWRHILFRLVQGDFDPEITFQKVCVQYIEREIIIL